MNRRLQFFNLVGVLVLTVLSAIQWEANRRVQLNMLNLQKAQSEQAAKLAERDQKIRDSAVDLDGFRERVAQLDAALKEAEAKLAGQNGVEQDQLKKSTDEWAAAIAARDEEIKKGNEQIESVVVERNAAIAKFNDLAGRFNTALKELNEARARIAAGKSNANATSH